MKIIKQKQINDGLCRLADTPHYQGCNSDERVVLAYSGGFWLRVHETTLRNDCGRAVYAIRLDQRGPGLTDPDLRVRVVSAELHVFTA